MGRWVIEFLLVAIILIGLLYVGKNLLWKDDEKSEENHKPEEK